MRDETAVPALARDTPREVAGTATTSGSIRAAYAQFVVDPSTDRVHIRIIDSKTDEVIREIPSEETERIAESLRAYAARLARSRAVAHDPYSAR